MIKLRFYVDKENNIYKCEVYYNSKNRGFQRDVTAQLLPELGYIFNIQNTTVTVS